MIADTRPVNDRPVPPVAGIDLEQALNFIDLDAAGEEFVYMHYTASRLVYRPGDRPELESLAVELTAGDVSEPAAVASLTRFVSQRVLWAGYYRRDTGRPLPGDRDASEEEIIRSGYGWCNEQARVLCCLTQACGLPSRLVFASDRWAGYGHVICEVLLSAGWLAVDQSLGFMFTADGLPVRASRIYRDPQMRALFEPLYRDRCQQLIAELGPNIPFGMGRAENPLGGFRHLGYHNHFLR